MVDALGVGGDEGRGVAAISFGEVLSNLWSGDFRMGKPDCVKRNRLIKKVSREPGEVKHLSTRRKRKQCQCFTLVHSLSSGERKGKSPNRIHNLLCVRGCKKITSGAKHITCYVFGAWGRAFRQKLVRRNFLERNTIEGDSPVSENPFVLLVISLKYLRKWKPWGKHPWLCGKAKYYPLTDSELVPWGKGEK